MFEWFEWIWQRKFWIKNENTFLKEIYEKCNLNSIYLFISLGFNWWTYKCKNKKEENEEEKEKEKDYAF